MKFGKKKVVPASAQPEPLPTLHSPPYHKHSKKLKQRAFELFMLLDETKLHKRYKYDQIIKILREEFKDRPNERLDCLSGSLLSYWAYFYGWHDFFDRAMEKAKAAANDRISQGELFEGMTAGVKANTTTIDQISKAVEHKQVVVQQIDKLSNIAAAAIVDLFMLNQEHHKKLMKKDMLDNWEYDCDKFGRRKQLFDMWMAGTVKMLELYNLTPPKKTATKTTVTTADGKTCVDSITTDGVNLDHPSQELVLQLFGKEQVKGGFGNELDGPDNADFPSTAGIEGSNTEGAGGPHKEGKGH